MGIYAEYLDKSLTIQDIAAERKKQLTRISDLRGGRDILVFAADLTAAKAPTPIGYADLLPIQDQLSNLGGNALDLVLETPGGSGEAAEDIIRACRSKYQNFAVIVPGWAKSAGAIMAMAGDEILMDSASALGPIDAQLQWQGKIFSAEALLEGVERIKEEVTKSGNLNRAYIPILQGISPGELQSARNVLGFSERLVTRWLAEYKFRKLDDTLEHRQASHAQTKTCSSAHDCQEALQSQPLAHTRAFDQTRRSRSDAPQGHRLLEAAGPSRRDPPVLHAAADDL